MSCKHLNFDSKSRVARVEDVGRFVFEVSIRCTDCNTPFQFIGVEPGFNYDAPTVALDGLLVNLPICPQGQRPTPLQGVMGYTVKAHN